MKIEKVQTKQMNLKEARQLAMIKLYTINDNTDEFLKNKIARLDRIRKSHESIWY